MGNHLTNNIIRELPTYLLRVVKRKTRRINAIPRAEKAVDRIQDNPSRAPIHEATKKHVEQLLREHPEKVEELTKKDDHLLKNLESVYVKSTGENSEIFSKKRLPDSYGYRVMRTRQPEEIVPGGKYNSTRAEHFLAAHERDSEVYSAETLADVYKVDTDAMKNILEYVKVYSVALPMEKSGEPGMMRRAAQDLMPGGLYEEPEIRVLERKIQLARDKMAKLYKQQHNKPEKLYYDMNMFESLVAIKPLVKKFKDDVKEELIGAKSMKDPSRNFDTDFHHKPGSTNETADVSKSKNETVHVPKDIPENVNDDSYVGKAKDKLIKYGVLETPEEIREERKADELRAELNKVYVNPYESIAEHTTVSSPETEKEDHFALETARQLENILLLEDKKKDDRKNEIKSISSSDSTEVKDAESEDVKTEYKKKLSDKG